MSDKPPLRIITQPERVREDIVQMFEDYAERARQGEFDGAAVIVTRPDKTFATNYSDHMDTMALVGSLAYVQARIIAAKDDSQP